MEKQTKEQSSRDYSVRDEKVKILVQSRIRQINIIRMRRSRKSCAIRPREGWKHAVRKFRRVVSINIAVENR